MYSDGSDRDVTSLATFMTNNDNSVPDHARRLSDGRRARRSVYYGSVRYTHGRQPGAGAAEGYALHPAGRRRGNYVDELVGEKLKKLRILPSGICTDEEFLRRVTVDITGQLPPKKNTERSSPMRRPISGRNSSIACWIARSFRKFGP